MSRSIFSCRAARTALVALAAAALVAACAGRPFALNETRYDLGPVSMTPSAGALPPLKVLEVSAPPPLDNDGILYRLSTDAQRTGRYAHSRWTMSPARLLTMRLRTSLGAHATVLSGADAVQAPMLKVELDQFEQVFASATESFGVLTARATLIQGGKVIAQRAFVARVPASSPDAAGGVRALAAASDDFVGQVGAWLGTQQLADSP
ncbi:MAG: ABC transporter [Paraburkholderia sp.]|uniref:ABC-type transport auxiliary lipoprotein family protein n=1 Tax=Paraburkholderia sp. TaxID=1926495 RepID=UPI0011F66AD9|nr:ABC-type transport auxiliary lipoprotein family protein [Paraburkholderia sp.]TAM00843.1 MAG: ABC transporter [Paraburkholderia sp.]TAM30547.1 MAG: ABC transporter [Paraburkholderia sp.]